MSSNGKLKIKQIDFSLSNDLTIKGNGYNLDFSNIDYLYFTASSGSISTSDGKGLVYTTDYSAGFVTHSLVDKLMLIQQY